MKKLLIVGDQLDFSEKDISTQVLEKDKIKILKLASDQLNAGANYLNIRVGEEEKDKEVITWLVENIQKELDNCPLFLDSLNKEVIEAGLKVYNREKAKPFINSADNGKRQDFLDLAADYAAKIVCVCMKNEVPMNETERVNYCTHMLETGITLGINPDDMYFDPVIVPIIEEQDRLIEVLKTIKEIDKLGLHSICCVSYITLGVKEEIKSFIESAFLNMAMLNGLDAAILDPLTTLLMANVIAGENILNQRLFAQGEFDSIIDDLKKRLEDYKEDQSRK